MQDPLQEITEDSFLNISAKVISNSEIEEVHALFRNGNNSKNLKLNHKAPYEYSADVPDELHKPDCTDNGQWSSIRQNY